uniref:SMODS and SLOG-associating 2TM effector domain-containing protein n=1 Tax=viral metagenome TaxID=1070528 RepID=A0A6C0B0I2_9ZZZZ
MDTIEDGTFNESQPLTTAIVTKNMSDIEWTTEHEQILIEWADKAMCYRWLHSKSNSLYSRLNALYTIPVIIISTLTGTANFAQTRVPVDYQNYFAMIVGGFNLLAGIISTIQQFLKITQLNEAHRVSSIAWDKFYRNVKIELAKHPNERMNPTQLLKISKEEFDRLMETSPNIPDKIILLFTEAFNNSETFSAIVKPEICDALISTEKFRNPWFDEDHKESSALELIKTKTALENRLKMVKITNNKIVKEFKSTFFQLNNREPMDSEILDNLKEKIDPTTLQLIIHEQKSNQNSVSISISNDETTNQIIS